MRYIGTKSILSKLRTADTWFGIAYNMNLYRGCQHGCIYCDTRSDCYGIGDIARKPSSAMRWNCCPESCAPNGKTAPQSARGR